MDRDDDLHNYLRTQFSDFEWAKAFMWRWVNEMDQELPGFGLISSRSLAAHCSAVLENAQVQMIGSTTNYMASKYGSELYWAAWGDPPANVEFSGTPAASSPEAPLERRVGPSAQEE